MKIAKEFMNQEVVYLHPEAMIFDVARVFSEKGISGAPVVENDKVIGMISLSDIIKFMTLKLMDAEIISHEPQGLSFLLLNLVKLGKDFIDFKKELERISKLEIKYMMSKDIVSIKPDANLIEVAEVMEKHDVNRLPVIEDGRLIGIIARADLIKALIE
ncbi:MAG: CBS domain-containing protein [Candidatus Aenigmatarchaeota archaeon]